MDMDRELLQKALYDLHEIHRISYQEMTRASGVHNIGRIVSGDITPFPDSWWKLHEAYPDDIPPPQYKDGRQVFVRASGSSSASGRDMTVTNNRTSNIDPEDQVLLNLIKEKGRRGKECRRKFIIELMSLPEDVTE